VATGHYARVVDSREGPHLLRALDRSKDQAYFLSRLDPEVLSGLLLPIGGLTKTEVRAVARARGLAVADRRESQDACLRADGLGLAETLRQKFQAPARPGKMVTVGGEVLGQHPGLHRFTIGQRRGLGVALGSPAFVVGLRAQDATVVVSTDEQDLLAFGLSAEHVRWMARPCTRCEAQIRSRHDAAAGRLELENNGRARFWFDQPQRAVAPGQAVAFFAGERVLGGGWIERALGPGSASLSDIEECLGLGDP
jgi:tRNA-specific 2-thiouridylase